MTMDKATKEQVPARVPFARVRRAPVREGKKDCSYEKERSTPNEAALGNLANCASSGWRCTDDRPQDVVHERGEILQRPG